ncbi:tetratricopeptide repeat protein [Alkalinema pantanalense CENA528]|uniref:tetratricopeptide repeat protein n=1 Tax=Alkalinema pantanalense TaxID=1620705 RepID=UPI003D6F1A1B
MASKDQHLGWIKKGDTALEWKQHKQAIAAYEKAIKAKSNCVEAWTKLGRVCMEIQDWDRAIAAFDKVIKLEPENFDGYFYKAAVQEEAGQIEAAEATHRQMVQVLDDHPGCYFSLGTFLNRQKRYEEALEFLDQAVAMAPNPMNLTARSFSYESLERYEEALADLNRVDSYGAFYMVYHSRGQLLEKLQRYDEALEVYKEGLEQDPVPLLIMDQAYLLETLGRTEEAEAIYAGEIENEKAGGLSEFAYNIKAQTKQRLERYDEAIAIYEEGLQEYPDNPDFIYEIAICYSLKGDTEQALQTLKRAIAGNADMRDWAKEEPLLLKGLKDDDAFKQLVGLDH